MTVMWVSVTELQLDHNSATSDGASVCLSDSYKAERSDDLQQLLALPLSVTGVQVLNHPALQQGSSTSCQTKVLHENADMQC